MKRWAEHFDGVLNRPSSISDGAINRLPQVVSNPLLDEFPNVSDLQSRMSSSCRETDKVISGIHPSRIQGCNNYPPFETERESSSVTIIWDISLKSVAGKTLAVETY